MTLRILALDFGGTKLAAALVEVTESGAEVAALNRAPTPGDARASRALMRRLADDLAERSTVDAAGVSFGGPVDMRRGVVRGSMHIGGWEGCPLAAAVSERYAAPCALLNDANAGALGEQRWGAGRGTSDVVYVTISTGVGAGLVLGGRLQAGARGLSGELGHLVVAEDGPLCSCGRRGCVEAFASGPSIVRAARDALVARLGHGAILRSIVGENPAALGAPAVAEAAHGGDDIALAVLAEAGRALGVGLVAAAVLCDPAVIVLGGSVAKIGEPLLGPAREVLRARAFAEPPGLLTSALDLAAPLYGAAAAAADLLVDQQRCSGAEPPPAASASVS